MRTLRDIQLNFVEAVLSGNFGPLAPYVYAPGSTPERRLAVYRNNTLSNLRGALHEVYPIIEKLVGPAFFNQTAKDFIATLPSTSGDLNDYGNGFAEFLAEYVPAAGLPYLPDVARLEWALERAYFSPDHPSLELQRLSEIPPDRYEDLRIKLHSAVTLLRSDYPLQAIWEVHQLDYEGEGFVDLAAGGVMLLITRRRLQTVIESLAPAEFAFLSRLHEGESFMVAVTAALEIDEAFSLQECLVRHVMQGDIVDFDV